MGTIIRTQRCIILIVQYRTLTIEKTQRRRNIKYVLLCITWCVATNVPIYKTVNVARILSFVFMYTNYVILHVKLHYVIYSFESYTTYQCVIKWHDR